MKAGIGLKVCPFCKEQIREEAVKCRFCGEWLEQKSPSSPPQPQQTKPEKDQAWLETVAIGESVFRDLQESLNLYPSREQWEHEFLTRKNPQKPIPPHILEELWKDSVATGRKPAPIGSNCASSTPTPAALAAATEGVGKPPQQRVFRKSYWYGYLYMLFCGYLAAACAGYCIVTASKPALAGDAQAKVDFWVGIVMGSCATAFFAYVTYMLSQRRVRMGLIYAVVTLHGIGVLLRGIRPIELIIWVALSGVVVTKFQDQKRLEANEKNEAFGYELLEKATHLETKGNVQEALATYRQIAEKYSHTAAGQDAQKSLESLQSKVGQ